MSSAFCRRPRSLFLEAQNFFPEQKPPRNLAALSHTVGSGHQESVYQILIQIALFFLQSFLALQ